MYSPHHQSGDLDQKTLKAPSSNPITIDKPAVEACRSVTAPLVDDELDELEELEDALGVAIGVLGLYVTPFAVAATSKTLPLPYS